MLVIIDHKKSIPDITIMNIYFSYTLKPIMGYKIDSDYYSAN